MAKVQKATMTLNLSHVPYNIGEDTLRFNKNFIELIWIIGNVYLWIGILKLRENSLPKKPKL
jgi:hypothetical protein